MTTRAVFMNGRNASPQRNWCLLAVFQPTATKATASASSCAASLRGAMRSGEARGGRSRGRVSGRPCRASRELGDAAPERRSQEAVGLEPQ